MRRFFLIAILSLMSSVGFPADPPDPCACDAGYVKTCDDGCDETEVPDDNCCQPAAPIVSEKIYLLAGAAAILVIMSLRGYSLRKPR